MPKKTATKGIIRTCYAMALACLALVGLLVAAVDTNYNHEWPRPARASDAALFAIVGLLLIYGCALFTMTAWRWKDELNKQLP